MSDYIFRGYRRIHGSEVTYEDLCAPETWVPPAFNFKLLNQKCIDDSEKGHKWLVEFVNGKQADQQASPCKTS